MKLRNASIRHHKKLYSGFVMSPENALKYQAVHELLLTHILP